MKKEIKDIFADILIFIGVACIIGLALCGFQSILDKILNPTSPVEEMIHSDSLTRARGTLIIEINSLDSIKNAKVIEVRGASNDSTLSLFYQLISEE